MNFSRLIDVDGVLLALVDTLKLNRALNFSESIDTLSRNDMRSKGRIHFSTLVTYDSMSFVRVPKFHRLDFKDVLEDLELRADLHPVLV